MSLKNCTQKKEILRVALDANAAHAVECMAQELRSFNEYLKFHPSDFVSRIVSDYFNLYFKSNKDHLVAAFFDSHAYVTAQTNKAKDSDNFMEVMQQALEESKRIKNKLHRIPKNNGKVKNENPLTLADDTTL